MELLHKVFVEPMQITGIWRLAMLAPLALSISIVYKAMRCERLQAVPVASLTLTATIIVVMMLIGLAGTAQGANDLNLSNTPLFLGDSVDPNVFIEIDDSGSMDWDVLTARHWHYCAYDSDALGSPGDGDCGWLISNGLLRLNAVTDGGVNGGFQDFDKDLFPKLVSNKKLYLYEHKGLWEDIGTADYWSKDKTSSRRRR